MSNPKKRQPKSGTPQIIKSSTAQKKDESSEWDDAYIYKHITRQYPKKSETEEVNIAAQFLTYLFTGEINGHLKNLIYATASLLRNPQKPNVRIFDSNLNLENFRLPTDFIFSEKNFLKTLMEEKVKQGNLSLLEFQMRLIQNKKLLISYSSYLATITLRLSIKKPENVKAYIMKTSSKKFTEFFTEKMAIREIPEVPERVMTALSKVISKTCPMFINHFAQILKVYKAQQQDPVISRYLTSLILQHTEYNGLRLIRDYYFCIDRLHLDHENFLNRLKKCPGAESLPAIEYFHKKYADKSTLWPWARMLDNSYFFQYHVTKHKKLGVNLVALLEPYDGVYVWKAEFLNDVSEDEKSKARVFAKKLVADLKSLPDQVRWKMPLINFKDDSE